MKPKPTIFTNQADLYRNLLVNQLNPKHPWVILANQFDWESLENEFSSQFLSHRGRPALPVRLVIGMLIIQHKEGLSDSEVVSRWVENPYWQFFCGMEVFTHKVPMNPSSLTRWRKYLGPKGAEKILASTIANARKQKHLKTSELKRVNVDTTVQEKAITHPTDGKLMLKAMQRLVKAAQEEGIALRQTYQRIAPAMARQAGRYAHASQYNRMHKQLKELRTRLLVVTRDVERKAAPDQYDALYHTLTQAISVAKQYRNKVKQRIYSLHAPEVECISKGKAHKRYEFGCKVSLVTTNQSGWVLGIEALHGKPYDGHTLSGALEQAEHLTKVGITHAFVDKGYRGNNEGQTRVVIHGQRKLGRSLKQQLRRRSHIEASIGHMKNKGRLDKNWLKGKEGDQMHALLCGIGHNFRLLWARAVLFCLYYWGLIQPSHGEDSEMPRHCHWMAV